MTKQGRNFKSHAPGKLSYDDPYSASQIANREPMVWSRSLLRVDHCFAGVAFFIRCIKLQNNDKSWFLAKITILSEIVEKLGVLILKNVNNNWVQMYNNII